MDPSSSQSRAPSAGPTAGSATPDSNSRLSAEDAMSHCPSSHSQTPAPASSSGPPPGSQPPPGMFYVSFIILHERILYLFQDSSTNRSFRLTSTIISG